MTFQEYLAKNCELGHIDHIIRASANNDGTVTFYIHAHGYDSDTLDFIVCENTLIPKNAQGE